MENIKFIIENWSVIVTLICACVLIVTRIIEFIGYPTEKKKAEIKSRLLKYVTEAEKDLGSSTGTLKLARVYDEFCKAFPYTKKWISIEKLSNLVDDVLPTMRNILDKSNKE